MNAARDGHAPREERRLGRACGRVESRSDRRRLPERRDPHALAGTAGARPPRALLLDRATPCPCPPLEYMAKDAESLGDALLVRYRVRDVMTAGPPRSRVPKSRSCPSPERMLADQIHRLPVVDEGDRSELVGIVTSLDLARCDHELRARLVAPADAPHAANAPATTPAPTPAVIPRLHPRLHPRPGARTLVAWCHAVPGLTRNDPRWGRSPGCGSCRRVALRRGSGDSVSRISRSRLGVHRN